MPIKFVVFWNRFNTLNKVRTNRMGQKDSKRYSNRLKKLRKKIDLHDRDILRALAKRGQVVDEIGVLKLKALVTIRQKNRWKQLMAKRLKQAKKMNIDFDLVRKIFELIQQNSILRQKRVQSTVKKKMGKGK